MVLDNDINARNSLLQVLNYTSKILFPKYPPYLFPLYSFIRIALHRRKRGEFKLKLKLMPVPRDLFEELIQTVKNIDKQVVCDRISVLLVPKSIYEYLIRENANNWVSLMILNDGRNKPSNTIITSFISTFINLRNVQILPFNGCDPDCVILTENTFFNIKSHFGMKQDDFFVTLLKNYKNVVPKICKSATISLIHSHFVLDIPTELADAALSNYFKTPKLMYENDIYEIDLNVKSLGSFYYKYMSIVNNAKSIYIKCDTLTNENEEKCTEYFVVKSETALHEKSTISSFLPKKIYDTIPKSEADLLATQNGQNIALNDRVISTCPSGLLKYKHKLEQSILPFIYYHRDMKIQPMFLVQGPIGSGKALVVQSLTQSLGIGLITVDCSDLMSFVTGQSEAKFKYVFNKAKLCTPVVLCLQSFEVFGLDQDGNLDVRLLHYFQDELKLLFDNNTYPLIIIALSNEKVTSQTIQRIFLETVVFESPNEEERLENLNWITRKYCIDVNADILQGIAENTGGFLFEDLKVLVHNSRKVSHLEGSKICLQEHFDNVLEQMHYAYGDSIGAPKVPKVNWSDIGGLANLKQEIIKSINMPNMSFNNIANAGMKRSGILLYGPPGTGKTLLAKAIATETKYNFLSVKGPELLNMYVGQSEQNIRDVFERARSASPCVIFFDELDSLAPNRGATGDSGGVMDRVVSQLLSEMDGITDSSENHTLFIVGATNRPDLIDPALLRPGRFDKLLYVGLCNTFESKCAVVETLTSKFNLESDVTPEAISRILEGDMTGADLYSVCAKAWMNAVRKVIQKYETGLISKDGLTSASIIVTMGDFQGAADNFVPSVNADDMKYFNQVQSEMTGKR